MPAHRPLTRELLMSKVHFAPSGCWEWTSARSKDGYGSTSRDGVQIYAHRAIVELDGRLPAGTVVMHTCDNPPCINPDHLVVGTQAMNVRDMFRKRRDGRTVRPPSCYASGSRVGTSVLSEAQVSEMRRLREAGASQRKLAALFGVSKPTVQRIIRREYWKHVA